MIETITQMRKRHEKEIVTLQTNCKHPKLSKWMPEYWAIAHGTGFEVRVCNTCEKVIKRKTHCWKCGLITENPQNGTGSNSRPFGSWYCPKCIERTPEEIKKDSQIKIDQEKVTRTIKTPRKLGVL
jgi:hypothetical protein